MNAAATNFCWLVHGPHTPLQHFLHWIGAAFELASLLISYSRGQVSESGFLRAQRVLVATTSAEVDPESSVFEVETVFWAAYLACADASAPAVDSRALAD